MKKIPQLFIELYMVCIQCYQHIHCLFIPLFRKKHETKIFCIGYAKTGTSSLSKALSILGYRSVHWLRTGKEPQEGWISYLNRCRYDAFADMPIIKKGFFQTLDKEFSGCKFILTVRDTESLLNSWYRYFKGSSLGIYTDENKQKVKRFYESHNQDVLSYFANKSNKLLVMNIFKGDGWNVLCPFLDKPIPHVQFPHKRKGKNKKSD